MMAKCTSPLLLTLALLAVVLRAYGQDLDLLDAFGDEPTKKPKPAPKPPKIPTHDAGDLDLADFFDDPTQPPKVVPKPPPKKPDVPITTRKPRLSTNKPPKKKDPNDLDLADALDDKNDRPVGGGGGGGGGGGISDSDLDDIFNDGYKPDKGKGGHAGGRGSAGNAGESDTTGTVAETGTIAGIASALAMALIGAVTSYISYQQKKFCFSIQQGLNAEYVKGEHMEAVVSEEPQVKYSALEHQSAVPPSGDPSKV
ncbi:CD99 antigen-like protein 2 isoform X1 [Mixophyes fleayi]|uniref:CD99 antigen-like protein 2 isoform X1 n=1 Tax=Mixophyes fleayi TaxID=3061075 RepID=UPI003F4DB179